MAFEDETEETKGVIKETTNRIFWEATLASGITFWLYRGSIREALLYIIVFVFVLFVVVMTTEHFFDK
jgi:hypothetical protein